MIKIDKQIQKALRDCFADDKGGQSRIARQTGIQQASLSRWISGQTQNMGNSSWLMIEPYIRPYLPQDYQPKDVHGKVKIINHHISGSTITQHVQSTGKNSSSEVDPLVQALLDSFVPLSKKDKLKVLSFIEEELPRQKRQTESSNVDPA